MYYDLFDSDSRRFASDSLRSHARVLRAHITDFHTTNYHDQFNMLQYKKTTLNYNRLPKGIQKTIETRSKHYRTIVKTRMRTYGTHGARGAPGTLGPSWHPRGRRATGPMGPIGSHARLYSCSIVFGSCLDRFCIPLGSLL